MKYLNSFKVKFIPATNSRGSRVSITSFRDNSRLTVPFDYAVGNTLGTAEKALSDRGFTIIGYTETKDYYIILSDTYKTLSA